MACTVLPTLMCVVALCRSQAFAKAYYNDNKAVASTTPSGAVLDPRSFRYSSPDVLEVLTFSLIMLHTDAHNPSMKKERKMTLQQFITNNRSGTCVAVRAAAALVCVPRRHFGWWGRLVCAAREIDGGKDLPREVLEYLYHSIVSNEIKMLQHATAPGDKGGALTCLLTAMLCPSPTVAQWTNRKCRLLSHYRSVVGCWLLSAAAAEVDPGSSFVAETTTAVHQAVAHMNSQAKSSASYKKVFNRDVVACMLEDVWADVMQVRLTRCEVFGRERTAA